MLILNLSLYLLIALQGANANGGGVVYPGDDCGRSVCCIECQCCGEGTWWDHYNFVCKPNPYFNFPAPGPACDIDDLLQSGMCMTPVCHEEGCCAEGLILKDDPTRPQPACVCCDPAPGRVFPIPWLGFWKEDFDEIEAFAVQFYNDITGEPLLLNFINDATDVENFVNSLQIGLAMEPPGPTLQLTNDATIPAFVKYADDSILEFNIMDIFAGGSGFAVFGDLISIPVDMPAMLGAIESGYGLVGYSSTEERGKEKQKGENAEEDCEWEEEEDVVKDPPPEEENKEIEEIELVIYQDNKGENWLQKYAEDKATDEDVEAFGANGKNSIVNKLKCLKAECKCVKTLTFAVHGSPGSIRIGPEGTPYDSPTRVGEGNSQTDPDDFGDCINDFLCDFPVIHLLSCSTAATAAGKDFIEDLAGTAGGTVRAYDQCVGWTVVAGVGTDPTTSGNCFSSDAGAGAQDEGVGGALDP